MTRVVKAVYELVPNDVWCATIQIAKNLRLPVGGLGCVLGVGA